jgi:hypothetical protein
MHSRTYELIERNEEISKTSVIIIIIIIKLIAEYH